MSNYLFFWLCDALGMGWWQISAFEEPLMMNLYNFVVAAFILMYIWYCCMLMDVWYC
jgi:hypothetical protein